MTVKQELKLVRKTDKRVFKRLKKQLKLTTKQKRDNDLKALVTSYKASAQELIDTLGADSLLLAQVKLCLAKTYLELRKMQEALNEFLFVEDYYSINSKDHQKELNEIYHGIATCHDHFGQEDEVKAYYEKLIENKETTIEESIPIYDFLTNYYMDKLQFELAYEYSLICLKCIERIQMQNFDLKTKIIIDNTYCAYRIKKHEDSIAILEGLLLTNHDDLSKKNLNRIYRILLWAYLELGNKELAEKYERLIT